MCLEAVGAVVPMVAGVHVPALGVVTGVLVVGPLLYCCRSCCPLLLYSQLR